MDNSVSKSPIVQSAIDIVQWYLGAKGPERVCCCGGRRTLEDSGEERITDRAHII
jgi:hypothetical protein